MTVIVNEAGEVWGVRVIRGREPLTSVAVSAVRQWVYRPFTLHGVRVPAILTVSITFYPDQHRKPPLPRVPANVAVGPAFQKG